MDKQAIPVLRKCFKTLALGLSLGAFYALFIVAAPWLSLDIPAQVLTFYWAIVKLSLAVGLICLYRATRDLKIAFTGILMISSGLFSFFPVHMFVGLTFEALAITGLSLILFDLNKAFPGLRLSVAAGLIFLGVIFSVVNNPMMHSFAGFSWLWGFLVAAARVNVLSNVKAQ